MGCRARYWSPGSTRGTVGERYDSALGSDRLPWVTSGASVACWCEPLSNMGTIRATRNQDLPALVTKDISSIIGNSPHRLALAGGWIDQPFVSCRNPAPPGSMVVVSLEPNLWFMDRAGIASGTRTVATALWNGVLPER